MSSTSKPLSRSTVARYASGSLATGGFATLPGLVLVYYLTDSLGVTALAAGLIVTLAKIWDVLIDPIIGGLSDRALARTGTRRGPMLVGAVGLPLAFIATFAVPAGLGPTGASVWVLVSFVAAATFFSMFQVPYIALPAELTDGYRERTRLLTWRVVTLTLGILVFGAGGPELRALFPDNPLLGYLVMAVGAAVMLAIGLGIATSVAPMGAPIAASGDGPRIFSLVHYRDGIRALRESQPFRVLLATFVLQGLATGLMLAGAQFVATWVLHDESMVTLLFVALIAPALVVAPLWRWIADRIGKERTFWAASVLFLAGTLVLLALLIWPGMWVLAPVALCGAAYAGMQTMPLAMLPDVIDHADRARGLVAGTAAAGARPRSEPTTSAHPAAAAEVSDPSAINGPRTDASRTGASRAEGSRGPGRAGVFGGVWTAGETAGMALGSTVLTLVLAATGYIESVAAETVVQPTSSIVGIVLSFSLLPACLMVASLAAFAKYGLREHDITGTEVSA